MRSFSFVENEKIKGLVERIEELKIAYQVINPLKQINEAILRQSLLRSALFSARVEGNPLTLNEIGQQLFKESPHDLYKREVFNLLSAYRFIYSKRAPENISRSLIFKLHQIVMRGISLSPGKFRQEPSAIFNQAGAAVYLAPSHLIIEGLIEELIIFVHRSSFSCLIKSAIAQFTFEKIHPFIDGNGRVGRLISSFILTKGGYFELASCLEEYVDENRNEYYRVLEPAKDATSFVEFFLEALLQTARKNLNRLNEKTNEEDVLLPRRKEILDIIKDHPGCSFDFIARRFSNVNPKTIHYDLKKMQDKGFIFKIGSTRGVLYQTKK